MDTRLLETFRQVAIQGSISAAARSLDYTQSAVSRQIAALEASVGARLFDRRGRGVQLTEHGRCFLPHAEALLERVEVARHELDAVERLEGGRLRVGVFPTAAASLVPRAMSAFAVEHPNVSLSLAEGITRRQLARLENDDADLAVVSAFRGQSIDRSRFDLVHLLDDAILVAVPRSHRLARRRRVRLADLAGERWVGAESSDDDRLLGPARLGRGNATHTDFVVREWTGKLGLAAAGLGITLVPSLAAEAARTDVALVVLDRRDVPPRRIYAATVKGITTTQAARAFVNALEESAARIRNAGW